MKFGKMKTQRRNRLVMVAFIVISAGVSVSLALNALNENINLFYEPEQILRGEHRSENLFAPAVWSKPTVFLVLPPI